MNKLHYINEVDYITKSYITDINWNKKSSYEFERKIIWYLNQNNIDYSNQDEKIIWKEYQFTCDVSEDIKTWNYIDFNWERYSIKNVSKHNWITLSHTRIILVKQD